MRHSSDRTCYIGYGKHVHDFNFGLSFSCLLFLFPKFYSYHSRMKVTGMEAHSYFFENFCQTEHTMITCNLGPENVPGLSYLQDVKDMDPNRISEEMVKCLSSIFLKLTKQSIGSEQDISSVVSRSTSSSISLRSYGSRSTVSCKTPMQSSEEIDFRDPYGVCADSEVRDVGPYKHLHDIITTSIDLSQIPIAIPFLRRLK